jgi:hypothetical protein
MRQPIKYIASHYLPTGLYLHLFYRWRFGRWANLRPPTTLNEKLFWAKLYGHQPFHTIVSDKYAVREWVARRIGTQYLIPLVAVFERVDDLDWTRLPEAFVVKATHGSGYNVLVRDKRSVDASQLKKRFRAWVAENHYYLCREPQYRQIKPRLIVEPLITDAEGELPLDFKFHCFHGEVEAIQVDIDRFRDHRRNFYDSHWLLLPFTWSMWDRHGPLWPQGRAVEKPPQLDEMIAMARILSREFDYVRVDLYNCSGRLYFGELTLCPGGGWERFDPPSYDLHFGAKLDLRRAR